MEPFLNPRAETLRAGKSESASAPWPRRRQRSRGPLRKRQSTSAPTAPPAAGRGEAATAPLVPHTSADLQMGHTDILSYTAGSRIQT